MHGVTGRIGRRPMSQSCFTNVVFAIAGLLLLQACTPEFSSFGDRASGLHPSPFKPSPDLQYYPNDQLLAAAQNQFKEGNYGNAQHYYQRAVEVMPNDPEAWLGLAASYDRIRRFDLADRAYRQAAKYVGNRAEYYNNLGYSYLLRGNLIQAREYFLKAYELDPSNPTVLNNLELLRGSVLRPSRG